jgi:hypothetical protein
MKIVRIPDRAAQAAEPAAVLPELLGILSELSNLQARTARLAQMLVTTSVVVKADPELDQVLADVSDGLQDQPASEQPAEETATESTGPSNCDVSADGEASSGAVPQGEAPQAGTGSEMLADREEHSAKGAGEDEASAMDHHSSPAPTVPSERRYSVVRSDKSDAVLNLYAETTLTSAEIAGKVGTGRSSVTAYISIARTAGDPRVAKGEAARKALLDQRVRASVNQAPERDSAPRLRLPSAPSAVLVAAPATKSAELPKPVEKPAPRADFDQDKIMVVDVAFLKVHGPCGVIGVSKPFALSLERMADGGTYDVETLRDLGAWPRVDALKEHFRIMRPKLAAIGIDLVAVNKFMFRARRVEG